MIIMIIIARTTILPGLKLTLLLNSSKYLTSPPPDEGIEILSAIISLLIKFVGKHKPSSVMLRLCEQHF